MKKMNKTHRPHCGFCLYLLDVKADKCKNCIDHSEYIRKYNTNLIIDDLELIYSTYNDITDKIKSIPLDEVMDFHEWISTNNWFEAAEGEFDNSEEPNSTMRLTINELYVEYLNEKYVNKIT
jgi:hypothetical protein